MTLFTLGTDEGKKEALKRSKRFIFVTIFVVIFEIVYECFGHGVYSVFMIGAFAFPLVLGTLFWLLLSTFKIEKNISAMFVNIWSGMLYTFMLGFIYKGVLDIYGTSSNLTFVYWIAGGALFMLSLITFNHN